MELRFSSGIVMGVDYTLVVASSSHAVLTLREGRRWAAHAGALYITHIRTCSTLSSCWLDLESASPASLGAAVATVVYDSATSGDVEFFPFGQKVYKSGVGVSSQLQIRGRGLQSVIGLVFDPELARSSYDMRHVSDGEVAVTLHEGVQWAASGELMVVAYDRDDSVRVLVFTQGRVGAKVANIFPDPVVFSSDRNYHESQSKVVTIVGSGLHPSDLAHVQLGGLLRPTVPNMYEILFVNDTVIKIYLNGASKSWLPSFLSLSEGMSIPLMLRGIDTGAGVVEFTTPVIIGNVVSDIPGVFCDDSCEFSFDGVCDDGSVYGSNFADFDDYNNLNDDDDDDNDGFYYEYATHEPLVSACAAGSDCTDCGGVEAISGVVDPDQSDHKWSCGP